MEIKVKMQTVVLKFIIFNEFPLLSDGISADIVMHFYIKYIF